LPCLYTAGNGARFAREVDEAVQVSGSFWGPMLGRLQAASAGRREASLILNWRHPVVRRLGGPVSEEALETAVEVLYLQALLLGRHPLRGRETTLLSGALGRLIEGSLDGRQ
jgi:molecular chaperone HtpG